MTEQTFAPEHLANRAAGLERHIRRRNGFEYIAGGIVAVISFGAALLALLGGVDDLAHAVLIAGLFVLGIGTLIVLWQIHARTGSPQATSGREPSLRAYRAELVRQRDALRSVWLWYLAPFTPGLFVIYGAEFFKPEPEVALNLALLGGTLALVVFLGWLNLVAARQIDTEIKALDASLEES